MRPLQITLFILAFLVIGTQSFRHFYVKFLEPRTSVLDPYMAETEEEIAGAESLEELVAHYEEAWESVQAFEGNPASEPVAVRERSGTEPYAAERRLRMAVQRWEAQTNGIRKVRFYWTFGFFGVLFGLICFLRLNRWIGMASIIGGFTEMAVWTSPLMTIPAARVEFERLLNHRLVLSLISWALLIAVWLFLERLKRRAESAEAD